MTGQLFFRTAHVKVSKKIGDGVSTLNNSIEIRGRFQFKITADKSSSSNKCVLSFYNISKKTVEFISQENLIFILAAGYSPPWGDGAKTIYIGEPNAENGIHKKRQGADIITISELGDSEVKLQNAVTTISLKNKTTTSEILDRLLSDFDISIGHRDQIPELEFQNGFSASGRISNILNSLASKVGFEWSILNGELIILRKGNTINQRGYAISKHSGLIGIPVKSKDKVEFTTLLNHNLKPDVRIVLNSENLGSLHLKIEKINYQGDTFAGQWTQKIQAIPL